ncbi:MAG: hypothetical protein V4671_12735 [Armatimonadota bacterium]
MSTESESTTTSTVPPSSPVSAATYDTASAAAYGPNPADVEKNKVFAILAYLGILFLVPMLAAKESPFAMYHANQGLVLFLFAIALGVITMIPVVGIIGWVAHIVLMILGIINAANGQMKPLPLIGGITLLK